MWTAHLEKWGSIDPWTPWLRDPWVNKVTVIVKSIITHIQIL